jgi:hypothetical protein
MYRYKKNLLNETISLKKIQKLNLVNKKSRNFAKFREIKITFVVISSGREIWLSPVDQATWEARAVGWFEVDTPFRDNQWTSWSVVWSPP